MECEKGRTRIMCEENERHSSFEKIYEVVRQIPRGKVATYGQVAALASVFSDQCCFGGRRTCINPEIGIAAVAGKIPHRNLMLCMALLEFQIVCLGGKKRFHTFYFEFHLDF